MAKVLTTLTLTVQDESLSACEDAVSQWAADRIKARIAGTQNQAPSIQVVKGPPPGMTDQQVKTMAQAHIAAQPKASNSAVVESSQPNPHHLQENVKK